jgi:hypothetical protein
VDDALRFLGGEEQRHALAVGHVELCETKAGVTCRSRRPSLFQ